MKNHAVYVYRQAPVLGQALFRREAPTIFDRKILSTLQSEIDRRRLDWDISVDDTEGDFPQLKERGYDLIVCTPFIYRWLLGEKTDSGKVVFLTVMEYYQSITRYRQSSVNHILDFMERRKP